MKTTLAATTLFALLTATALPVLAQDAGAQVNAGAGVTLETPAVDANAGAAVDAAASATAGDNTFGSVTSSISTSSSVDLSTVTDQTMITIVLLSSLEGDAAADGAALDEALSANADATATLRANIDGNAALKARLEADGHAASDVVAIKSNADGSLIVYVDDRA